MVNDFEERLIRLLWRSAGRSAFSTPSPLPTYTDASSAHSLAPGSHSSHNRLPRSSLARELDEPFNSADVEKAIPQRKEIVTRTWFGRKKRVFVDSDEKGDATEEGADGPEPRPAMLWAPLYNGVAAALSFGALYLHQQCWTYLLIVYWSVYVGNGLRKCHFIPKPSRADVEACSTEILLSEWRQDGDYTRFALVALLPLLFCISLVCNLPHLSSSAFSQAPPSVLQSADYSEHYDGHWPDSTLPSEFQVLLCRAPAPK